MSCYGATAGYADEDNYSLQASYISNLADTDGIEGFMEDHELKLQDDVGGYALSGKANFGDFGLIGEFVSGVGDLEFVDARRDTPLAWITELSYSTELLGKDAILALGYQASNNLVEVMPESRILGTVGVELAKGLTAAFEYAHDSDYGVQDGGTSNDADSVTMQLALEF